jgi:biofilm PGA synthesis N-glycosyltransferase PgaC
VTCTESALLVLVRAGTVLHPSAVRLLVARLLRAPSDTAAVTAHALARNTRGGDVAELIAAESSASAHATQRVHGLFQAPLVAAGSCTLYRLDALRAVGGWTSNDDDGVEMTWRFLQRSWRVFHEPLAVVFTAERVRIGTRATRRVRSANAVVESARAHGIASLRAPWSRVTALVDAIGPLVDGVFTGAALLALALALMGAPALVLSYALLVLPLSAGLAVVAHREHQRAMDDVGLVAPRGVVRRLGPLLGLHAVQAPLVAWRALVEVAGRGR